MVISLTSCCKRQRRWRDRRRPAPREGRRSLQQGARRVPRPASTNLRDRSHCSQLSLKQMKSHVQSQQNNRGQCRGENRRLRAADCARRIDLSPLPGKSLARTAPLIIRIATPDQSRTPERTIGSSNSIPTNFDEPTAKSACVSSRYSNPEYAKLKIQK